MNTNNIVMWEILPNNANCECLFVNRVRGPFLSVHVDDVKMEGKNRKPGTDLENVGKRR